IGFKTSRVTFEETVSQLLRGATGPVGALGGSNPVQIGNGARLGSLDSVFTQGGIEATGVDTDLAIQGRAFFVLSDGVNSYYTRAGAFQLDGHGQLVNPTNGFVVQGFAYDRATGTFAAQPSSLRIPLGEAEPAKQTTVINYRGNREADSEPRGSRAQSGVLYDQVGEFATSTVPLINLRADSAGVVPLVEEGDEIRFSATVNGETVS